MHARLTRFEGSPDKADAGIKLIKEVVIPTARKLGGFRSGYWLMDRSSGKGFGVTVFESEAALKASEEAAAQVRQRASDVSTITGVERYEVFAHSAPRGASGVARVTYFKAPADKIDALIKLTKETIVPTAQKMSGFRGGYWLIDRASSTGLAVTLFDSEAARAASEESAAGSRSQATQQGATITGIDRFEVVAEAPVAEPVSA